MNTHYRIDVDGCPMQHGPLAAGYGTRGHAAAIRNGYSPTDADLRKAEATADLYRAIDPQAEVLVTFYRY